MRLPRTATVAIALLIAGVWLLITALGADNQATLRMGVIPARLSGFEVPFAAVPAWLTPLSSTLVHASLFHVGFNLLILIWCGTLVERVLGRRAMLVLYIVGAYVAAIAQWLTDPASIIPMVGASGAVSAVIGAFSLSFGQEKRIVRSPRLNRLLNSLWLLAAWIVLQMMLGLLAGFQGVLIAIPAHIGGFLAGILLQRPLLLWRYRGA